MQVIGEMTLHDSSVQLLGLDDGSKEFAGVFSAGQHLLHLDIDHQMPSLESVPRIGRYAKQDFQAFSRIGRIVFRPAGFRVEAHGVAPSHRLQCWLGEELIGIIRDAVRHWEPESLARTLDIRVRSISHYMSRLLNEVARPGFASSMVAEAILILVLSDIAHYVAGDQSEAGPRSGGLPWQTDADGKALNRVAERICDLTEVLPSIEELAQLAEMSKIRLLRLFQSHSGYSLSGFVKRMRLERAQHYLSFTDMSFTQISERLGFSSAPNFTTAFRREMRLTPREYRRQNRPRVVGLRSRSGTAR